MISTITVPMRANRPLANLRSLHATNMRPSLLGRARRGHRATDGSRVKLSVESGNDPAGRRCSLRPAGTVSPRAAGAVGAGAVRPVRYGVIAIGSDSLQVTVNLSSR
ncbi:hypothetical protein GCM10010305_17280 [Streptomyces termitum]|uniref:Uncharacterized protein n=1 Tax=Streptomyces termitum TaxID=67368 RepID=A0A918SWM2_9ACTN|nr:hypothetical protein GCM10010305_17280 [Streptomyces termitum]